MAPLAILAAGISALALLGAEQYRRRAGAAASTTIKRVERRERAGKIREKRKQVREKVSDTIEQAQRQALERGKTDAEITLHAVDVKDDTKPAAKAEPERELKPRKAAERLWLLVTQAIRSGKGASLGTASAPNEKVRTYQGAMGRIKADGIYGPETRRRGRELLGREFPARESKPAALPAPKPAPAPRPAASTSTPAASTSTEAPATEPAAERELVLRAPEAAAQELFDYARDVLSKSKGYLLGTKAAPSRLVQDAQTDMGEIAADGIYGPATRERGKALLGKTFPARV